jgi:DNA invertase Pin-like site-specific DNA recombinase
MTRKTMTTRKAKVGARKTSPGSARRKTNRRAIGYIRVSRTGGREQNGDSYIAPSEQRKRIEGIAQAKGYRIVRWETDENQSGAKRNRPALDRAMQAVKDGEADAIIVSRFSRFGRRVAAVLDMIEELDEVGAELIAGDMDLDTSSSTGKLVRSILAAVAEFELDVIRENIRDAQANAVARGVKVANKPPLGYRFRDTGKDKDGKKVRKPDTRLIPDPDIAPAIPGLFRLRAQGASRLQLVDYMIRETGKTFHPNYLVRACTNRVYLGEVSYGDLVAPREHWHKALVTEEEFAAADVKKATAPARSNNGSLLAGLLVCGSCQSKMTTRGSKAKPKYACQHDADRQCSAPVSVSRPIADSWVEEQVMAKAEKTGANDRIVKIRATRTRKVKAAEAKLAAARDRRETWQGFDEVSEKRPDVYLSTLERREAAEAACQEELDALLAETATEDKILTVGEIWNGADEHGRNQMLKDVIGSITIHRSATPQLRVPLGDRAAISWLVR